MKISIEQNVCRINSATILIDKDDFKLLCFDTKDKYPEFDAKQGEARIFVGLSDYSPSFGSRHSLGPTIIEIDLPEGWATMWGETGRYSLYLMIYRNDDLDYEKVTYFETGD